MKDIRREVKKYIDSAGDKTVKMIYAMLEAEHLEDARQNESDSMEMERRITEFEQGKARLYTLDEMENKARQLYKQ